jgi:Ni/Co efflux regulator RcnB
MKKYLVSAFALCLVSASTTAGAEQQRRGGSPQSGGHSAPSRPMGHPATNYHRPATHHVVHHTTVHHVWHHHHVSGHIVHHAIIHVTRPVVGRPGVHVTVGIGGLRRNITAAHRFHAGDYRAPPGYAYRRWTFGERLPSEYFARDFWISDYLNFDLVGPPDGYTWVRFGPDALLIDEDTGEIIQVEYGVFY